MTTGSLKDHKRAEEIYGPLADGTPLPPPTPLEELVARYRYKRACAVAIRRHAAGVLNRARLRESQYDERLGTLNEAIRLIERSMGRGDKHADDIAELQELAEEVGLQLTAEEDFDGGSDATADEDDEAVDDDSDEQDESDVDEDDAEEE